MSLSSAIDANNPNVIYRGKFYPDLIPFEHPPAQQNLGEVLAVGNQALSPTTGLPQDATDFNILGCVKIETGTVGMGNQPALIIGEPGDILQIKGGTALGSILVGNGADTEELPCPTTTTTSTTSDVYNWITLANGQSKSFSVSDGSLYQLGYSITITYSVSDSITGTITAVVGDTITITITSFTSLPYGSTPLITTTPPDPVTATSGGGDPVFIFNGATTTPNPPDIPPNSFLLSGTCFLYAIPAQPPLNISLTAINIASALVNATTNIFTIPVYENPPVSTSAFSWGSAGCYFPAGGEISLASNAGGNQIAFAFPSGGSFIDQNFVGTINGYSLAYSSGTISINSKLVLTADNTKPLGVFWGVDAQGVGTVTSVSAGNNISISGSLSAPVVNFQSPTTSNIVLGVGTEILATSGFTTMSIDSTGLNDTYLNGLVENKEDIAVDATSVIDTISTTNATTYQNSIITTCNTTNASTIFTASDLAVPNSTTGVSTINCSTTSAVMGVGCSIDGFPGSTSGTATLQADSSNPTISLTQSAPFSTSYSTLIDKDGIIQNNSAGNGFRCRSAQDIFLEPTAGQPNPQLGVIRVPNGNSINMSVDTYNTTYRKDGVGVRDTSAPSAYDGTADFYSTGGTSEMKLESDFTGTSEHSLSCRVALTGNATITHATTSGASRNLAISSTGNLSTASQEQTFTTTNNSTPSVPAYTFTNTSALNSSHPVIRFNRPNVSSQIGDSLSVITTYANDASGVNREWSRIQTKTENVSASPANQDSTISFFTSINGALGEVFNFNGAQNENNTFRPFDLNNNDIRTASGNIVLSGTLSSGVGSIELKSKDAVAGAGTGLILTGNTLLSASAGGSSGQHLCLTVNGVVYKIKLENP